MSDYLEPLREEMSATEARLTELETEVVELRKKRTVIGRALTTLDPQWAANHKPKKRTGGTHGITQERLDEIFGEIERRWPTEPVNAKMVSDALGIHTTTINRALKQLHDQGRIRLDHMGGAKKVSKFFTLAAADDG
jgi:response regulator of citrate/malate metabolism